MSDYSLLVNSMKIRESLYFLKKRRKDSVLIRCCQKINSRQTKGKNRIILQESSSSNPIKSSTQIKTSAVSGSVHALPLIQLPAPIAQPWCPLGRTPGPCACLSLKFTQMPQTGRTISAFTLSKLSLINASILD